MCNFKKLSFINNDKYLKELEEKRVIDSKWYNIRKKTLILH